MALDRQSIEKKDFPVGKRGYDPDAVDAHLVALADEIAEFKRTGRQRNDTLASAASEQVRAIIEAAEVSASEIHRQAESDAHDIREEATTEVKATRDQAAVQAREYVARVAESTNVMLSRVEAMEQELGSLLESLRAGSHRLTADLQLLESSLGDVSDVVLPRAPFEADSESVAAESAYDSGSSYGSAAGFGGESAAGETAEYAPGDEYASAEEYAPAPVPEAAELHSVVDEPEYTYDPDNPPDDESDDTEGARLIALNMALNGTPRAETERYLSENFQLSDAGGLLDEVYASVEG
ncbi:MAG: DivIVA domain-containing protein [Solirubrobacteraceae bacterium]